MLPLGVHHLFPLVRAFAAENCLHRRCWARTAGCDTSLGPYHQSPSTHSALSLFDRISQDNYYRALIWWTSRLLLEPSAN